MTSSDAETDFKPIIIIIIILVITLLRSCVITLLRFTLERSLDFPVRPKAPPGGGGAKEELEVILTLFIQLCVW